MAQNQEQKISMNRNTVLHNINLNFIQLNKNTMEIPMSLGPNLTVMIVLYICCS